MERPRKHILIFILIAALLAALLSAAAPLPQAAVTIRAEAGFDGRCKQNEWLPVRLTLENNGAAVDGRVEIRMADISGGESVYSQPVSLPTLSRKEIEIDIFGEGYLSVIDIALVSGRRTIATASARVDCVAQANRLFGVAAASSAPYNVLNGLTPSGGTTYILQLELAGIPERSPALSALSYLILSGVDTGELSEAQRQAIARWVASGGQLVVTGGSDWQKTAAGLAGLLPLVPTGTATLPRMESLRQVNASGSPPGSTVIATGDLTPDAEVLLWEGDLPLVARRPVGAGAVFYIAADPSQPPMRNWDGSENFYRYLFSAQPAQPAWANGFKNWSTAESLAASISTLDLPSGLLICGFLVLYVIVAGPVNYFVLARLKRRELAWISLPILVLGFSGAAFVFGSLMRGSRPVLNRGSIVQVSPGFDQAKVFGVVGIFSPNRATYQVDIGPNLLPHPIPGTSNSSGDWDFVQTAEGTRVEDLRIEVGGVRSIAVEGYIPAPAFTHNLRITSDQSSGGMWLEGEVTNASDLTLQDAVLLAPGTAEEIGDLPPGETRTFRIRIIRAGFAGKSDAGFLSQGGNLVTNPYYYSGTAYDTTVEDIVGNSAYYSDRESYIRYNLLNATVADYSETVSRGGGIYLTGWVESSPLDITIERRRYTSNDTSLYIITLVPELDLGQGSLTLPPGMFSWSQVSSTGMYGNASPYDLILEGDSAAVFDYNLAFPIRFAQVEALILHLEVNPSLKIDELEISLWDFYSGSYERLDDLSWGDNEIPNPERFIGPGGYIRLFINRPITGGSSALGQITINQADFTLVVEQ